MKNKFVFNLKKENPDSAYTHNFLGFDVIEVIQFNYDGKGSALVLEDGELSYLGKKQVHFLIFDGWYSLETEK